MKNRIQLAVLLTGPYLTLQPGGIQTHAQNFLSAFKDHEEITLTYFPVTRGLYNDESWTTKIYRFLGSVRPFLRACKAADVVHLNSTFDNRSLVRDCIYLLVATLISNKKVLVQFHGGLPSNATLSSYSLARRLILISLKQASIILFLSRKQGDSFSSTFSGLKYQQVPNYIDCGHDRILLPTKRSRTAPFRFVFIGRIDEKKGIREIVSAVKLLTRTKKEFEVRLIGDGPLREWLLTQLNDEPAIRDSLSYAGPAYGHQKEDALASADAVLLPSYAEGFPYALLEAAQHGLPLISTPVGAIDEVIRDGENGLLVSIADPTDLAAKMQYLIDNPDVAEAIGKRAREIALSTYSFANLTSAFSGMYIEMAGSK